MSYVDLATLTVHRRNELESRIHLFEEKCNHAISDINKLKDKTRGFVSQLNCEPNELKERFLMFMKKVDEYMYLITDFNLAVAQLEDGSIDHTPVQDLPSLKALPPPLEPLNLIDALSEPQPSTSCACNNYCPPERPTRKIPKEEQLLIAFSSSSSSDSMSRKEMTTKDVQAKLNEQLQNLSIRDTSSSSDERIRAGCNFPEQKVLDVDCIYNAVIMSVDGAFFWAIIDDYKEAQQFMIAMTSYYRNYNMSMTSEQIKRLGCCACYDEQTECFYRALYLRHTDANSIELFLVDTGEIKVGPMDCMRPLLDEFTIKPPYARCCVLAGLDIESCKHDSVRMSQVENYLKQYVGTECTVQLDDNTSEHLGLYVILSETDTLNELVLRTGLLKAIERSPLAIAASSEQASGLSMDYGPEYEDPVEAVTGYHNRDEADICKHYKGGPEKTCFKGSRCTKKHIMKHPDGWTYDRVEVTCRIKPFPLPAPGTSHRVIVTNVSHFNRIYVQMYNEMERVSVTMRKFGELLPPDTLQRLETDMNSQASKAALKPLTLSPAEGEIVAAYYPLDSNWYRAQVLSVSRADQNVQVRYIDYGTVMSIHENEIRVLEPRFTRLPVQALQCVLAGVTAKTHDSKQWATAKEALAAMIQDRCLRARIIARDYDEVSVELYDTDLGYNVAEQLAALNHVNLIEYDLVDDSDVTTRVVVP